MMASAERRTRPHRSRRAQRVTLGVLLALLAPAAASSAPYAVTGTVTRILDGDTFDLADGQRVRLWGVDSPERAQQCLRSDRTPYDCAAAATAALSSLALHKTVVCSPRGPRDPHGRMVALCVVDEQDLGGSQVRNGHAVDYGRYSRGFYWSQELEARLAGRGIWAGRFELPEAWRRHHPTSGVR